MCTHSYTQQAPRHAKQLCPPSYRHMAIVTCAQAPATSGPEFPHLPLNQRHLPGATSLNCVCKQKQFLSGASLALPDHELNTLLCYKPDTLHVGLGRGPPSWTHDIPALSQWPLLCWDNENVRTWHLLWRSSQAHLLLPSPAVPF